MTALRVVITDDHALVRSGIRALLESFGDIDVVGEAATGREALRILEATRPDVALMNVSMPELNGLDTVRRATEDFPHTRVLVLSMHADEEYARQALRLGAAGYLVKNAGRAELELAVRSVGRGEVWLSPAVAKSVLAALARPDGADEPVQLLTPRQREVLQLIAEGHSNKDIAALLTLSPKTVDAHRSQLMQRLGVRGTPALVRWAIRLGLVSLAR